MEGCSETSAGAVPGLPDDPLVEILSRVPAKSVCRFKCVSKAWRDLIAHPDHRKKLCQPMQGLFVQMKHFSNNRFYRSSFSFVELTMRTVPLDIDPGFSFLTELTGIKNFLFLDSCNGLILFGQHPKPDERSSSLYIVCNPTTKQWAAVPACGSRAVYSQTCLAFDPAVSSHFHLFQFQMPSLHELMVSLHVYSSEIGTWSQNQLDEQTEQGQLKGWHHQFMTDMTLCCTFFNGFLHTIVWSSDAVLILAIDVQGKARRMIPLPDMADCRPGDEYYRVYYLCQSQGHLHFVCSDKMCDKLSIWILQDYDTQEWVLKNTVDCLDIFGETGLMMNFGVVDIHQDCNVVFFVHQCSGCKLMAYDMDRKEVSVIATFKDENFQSCFARYIPYFKESTALTNKH